MSETANENQPKRRFDFPRLLEMLIHPSRAFAPMSSDKHSAWLTPMLALTLSSILVILVTGYIKTQTALGGAVELPPNWEFWTPEMQDDFLQAQQTTQGPVVNYVLPLLGSLVTLWLGWVIFSGIMRLTSTLLGGRGSMQSALNVVGWASVPFVIRDVLRAFFIMTTSREIVSPGLSGFVEAGFMSQLLARADLFFFWNIALLAIGFSVVDGLPKGKALVGVVVVVLILLVIQAGIGAAVSGFG
ncbi:MAG: Yip1 family protein [Anaerolineales bacterium]|nr:MAG: Yip1 family protein [Anaerolineales bacterium]